MSEMKKKKGRQRKVILFSVMVVILLALLIITTQMNRLPVDAAVVDRGDVVKLVKESGVIEAEKSIILVAKNTGEIRELLVEEGDQVSAGTLLMRSDAASAQMDIQSLQAELSGLQVKYRQAQDLTNRNRPLYEQGALSDEAYNRMQAEEQQLEAQVSALAYTIQSHKKTAGESALFATIAGTVTGVFAAEGETVTAGAPVVEISDLQQIYVKADLIAEDASLLKVGDLVRVWNKEIKLDDKHCTVKKIHVKAQQKMSDLGINQKRVTIEIHLGEEALSRRSALRLGSDVDVEVIAEQKGQVLRVPHKAIFSLKGKDAVYVIEEGKAKLREIEIGLKGENEDEVLSGLVEGELIILSPGNEVDEGRKVGIKN